MTTCQPSGSARVWMHRDRLRMAVAVDEKSCRACDRATRRAMAIASAAAVASSSSDALAISSPVRSAIMVWKFSKRLQPPLADLRLIRRIGGVPGRIFQDVALDHGRQ